MFDSDYDRIIAGLQILKKYSHYESVHAEDDCIYAGHYLSTLDVQDFKALTDNGWACDKITNAWYYYA